MRHRLSWTGAAFVMAVALLPMKTGGCGGKTACIIVSNGTCPSAQAVLSRFADPCFGGNIQSVDGEASLDGDLCCYPVTEGDNFGDGFCEGGFGGVAGSGGATMCISCSEQVVAPQPIFLLCPGADVLWNNLTTCACDICADACGSSICVSNPISDACQTCMFQSCPAELDACNSSF